MAVAASSVALLKLLSTWLMVGATAWLGGRLARVPGSCQLQSIEQQEPSRDSYQ